MNTFHATTNKTSKQLGDEAEDKALAFLRHQGCRLLVRNYRTPGRGGGEIDLIVRDPEDTVVFVEVRRRKNARQGGALASIGLDKRQRIVYAAQHYLRAWGQWPPCRFDVVVVQAGELQWLKAAFTA